jgi:hypothetical protein
MVLHRSGTDYSEVIVPTSSASQNLYDCEPESPCFYSPIISGCFLQADLHGRAPEVFASAIRTALLAFGKRDITVPTEIDSACAVSWYDMSSTSHSNMTSWRSGGSSSIALRTKWGSEYLTGTGSDVCEFGGGVGKSSWELKGADMFKARFRP